MLYSASHKFIFVKPMKTAGTSVELALQPFCVPPNDPITEGTDGAHTAFGIVGARRRPDRLPDTPWINHMSAAEVADRVEGSIWDSAMKIATVRNPFRRYAALVAHYDRIRHVIDVGSPKRDGKRADFLSDGGPYRTLSDMLMRAGRPLIDQVIRFENLQADFAELCQRLGVRAPALTHEKQSNGEHRATPIPELLTEDAIDAVIAQEAPVFDWLDYSTDPLAA